MRRTLEPLVAMSILALTGCTSTPAEPFDPAALRVVDGHDLGAG